MNLRLPTVIAVLSTVGLLAWMASIVPGLSAPPDHPNEEGTEAGFQERSGGSEVPCDVPLAWRIARVDPEFGLSSEQAGRVVSEAATLWEASTGRGLFTQDPDEGFPVRLVYDERQERLEQREVRRRSLSQLSASLTEERAAVAEQTRRYEGAEADHRERLASLDARISAYNEEVRAASDGGSLTEERRRELEARGAALDRQREEILAQRPALDAELASLQAAQRTLNAHVDEHARFARQLVEDFPPSTAEAGEYREAVTRVGGTVESVSREIRVYRFADLNDLRVVAAHELGHALGLGHVADSAAVMSPTSTDERVVSGLAASDLDLFRTVCPAP